MKCTLHPKYKAIREPSSGCSTCWKIYRSKGKDAVNNFIEKNAGQDRIKGRPIRLNKHILKVKPFKNYAEVLFWGDVHIGHPNCMEEKAQSMLDWALENNAYVLCMGDLIEAGLRDSVGDSVYHQKLNPQEQMEKVVDMLLPLAKKRLLLGLIQGNHCNRIALSTGINITKVMCKLLGVRYLGYSCWNLFQVRNNKYSIYTTHGASGARFKHTKLKSIMDLTQWISADVVAQGHVHSLASEPIIQQYVDKAKGQVVEKKCYVVLTGSYLGWDNSYAQMKNMPITKLGSPKAKFLADKKDVYFSL